MATIDKVCKEEANSFILFDPDIIKGLFRRGLIYFDVPVYPDDRFKGKSYVITISFLVQNFPILMLLKIPYCLYIYKYIYI